MTDQQERQDEATRPKGRISDYTPELGDLICARLCDGESLRAICRGEGMPDERTVRRWAANDQHPFAPHYARAREVGYLAMADELLEIADDGRNDFFERETKDGDTAAAVDHEHIQRSRLRVDTRKWLLSKMLPKVFGDRLSAEVTGKDGEPLIPEAHSTRDIARAILDIFRSLPLAEAKPEPEHEPIEEANNLGSLSDDFLPAPGSAARTAAPVKSGGAPGATAPIPEPPRPRSTDLRPGEREVLDNGAWIANDAEVGRYAIFDSAGRLHGYRRSFTEARRLASNIKGPPPEEPKA